MEQRLGRWHRTARREASQRGWRRLGEQPVVAHADSPVLDDRTRAWYETRAEQDDRLDLAVVDAATDACVGEVVLNDGRVEDQTISFRILIGPAGRDRGLGTQATALMVDHACTMSVPRPEREARRPS